MAVFTPNPTSATRDGQEAALKLINTPKAGARALTIVHYRYTRVMPIRRAHVALAVGVIASLAFVATALASSTYGGPKTWLPNYAANDGYDNSANRWRSNWFQKGGYTDPPYYLAMVTFIKSDGSWVLQVEDNNPTTYSSYGAGVNFNYQKKPYCQNTSTHTYVGACVAAAEAP